MVVMAVVVVVLVEVAEVEVLAEVLAVMAMMMMIDGLMWGATISTVPFTARQASGRWGPTLKHCRVLFEASYADLAAASS